MSDDLRTLPVDEFSIKATMDYYDRHKKTPHPKGACSICDEVRRRLGPVVTQLPLGATPDPSWSTDNDGYVTEPLVNRGTLDAG